MQELGWGRILILQTVSLYDGEPWALDNGAYKAWRNGNPFDGSAFLDRVEAFAEWAPWPPDFLVLPDIHRGGLASLMESVRWAPEINTEWSFALAVQDGMGEVDVDAALRDVGKQTSHLFLGGSDRFKSATKRWVEWGNDRGLKVHYGRCGTLAHGRNARFAKPDSIDSAFPLWEINRFEQLARLMADDDWQLELITRDRERITK